MESIDELRRYAQAFLAAGNEEDVLAFADEIEREIAELGSSYKSAIDEMHDNFMRAEEDLKREIAERYMLLPVDTEGVPIHVGDVLTAAGLYGEVKVCALQYDGKWRVQDKTVGRWLDCANLCHVKPRTVEDVLKEFGDWYKHVAGGCDEPGIIAKYADELRSMGVGE